MHNELPKVSKYLLTNQHFSVIVMLFCKLMNQLSRQKEVTMIERFEKLTSGITQVYKSIQRIKKHRMDSLGLKGSHVMCIYYLSKNPEGLTAADLCSICREDKAGISRILSDLEMNQFITYTISTDKRKYRAKADLTARGSDCALKVKDLIMSAVISGGKGISDEERELFYRVLFQVSENLYEICAKLDKETERISNSHESTEKDLLQGLSDSI